MESKNQQEGYCKYAVAVAMVYKNRVYMSKRNELANVFPNTWQFAGGKLNSDTENPIDSAIRELEEETGLRLNPKRMRYIGPIFGDPTVEVCYMYCVELFDGECPQLVEPHKMSPWYIFEFDLAQKFDVMPGIIPTINNLKKLFLP